VPNSASNTTQPTFALPPGSYQLVIRDRLSSGSAGPNSSTTYTVYVKACPYIYIENAGPIRLPLSPLPFLTPGWGGVIRFDLEPGTYNLSAGLPQDDGEAPEVALRLQGTFRAKAPGGANPVTGKWVDGNTLIAVGVDRGNGRPAFSTSLTVAAPVSFAGTLLADDDIVIDKRHLVYNAIAGGPQPLAEAVYLFNGSASTAGYTATFEPVGSRRWTAALSKTSGSIAAGEADSIEIRPQAELATGEYHGFLRFRVQAAAGLVERAVAVTVFVQPPAPSRAGVSAEPLMDVMYPLSGDAYETSTFRVTNNSGSAQTFAPQPEAGLTVTPRSVTLTPGESGTFTTVASIPKVGPGRWEKRCITINWVGVLLTPPLIVCRWVWTGLDPPAIGAAFASTDRHRH
jgi:hypothetical protein